LILRRLTTALRKQDWVTVVIETLIVVFGVFIGLQVNNWNEARAAADRRTEIIEALVTDLKDATFVQEQSQINMIDAGLAAWEEGHKSGEHPAPYYFRIEGSDMAPDTWTVLQQMNISGLLDPVTIFDLNFYYSELAGVGRKYVRYVTFVEEEILPYEQGDPLYFYTEDGAALKPEFQGSMDRLREYRGETRRLSKWAMCLTGRLESGTRPPESCLRTVPSINNSSLLAQPSNEEGPP
jgi:hypothetical protein